jgi:hypothetical protein
LKEIIATANTPNSIGPYSQAIEANGFRVKAPRVEIDLIVLE